MYLIEGKNLSLGYDGHVVVDKINFFVEEKDYLCVVGENGSGKTTLMKTLLGLQKPISGELIFSNTYDRKKIGYLAQQSNNQKDFPATVYEIVLSGFQSDLGMRPFYNKQEKQIALNNIERLGMLEHKDTSFKELSGGQQQRVLLARALCAAEKLLILDEPLTGLDPKVSIEMYELIKDLNESGMTIIMISHDIDMAIKYANKILHIGHNNYFGKTDDYLNSNFGANFLNRKEKTND